MAAKHRTASSRYEILPGLILAFHGTDEQVVEKVLAGKEHLEKSQNAYDWLGHGIYFWEYSPQRALEFAKQSAKDKEITQGEIKKPAVIGAVIDPGTCLNLLEASAISKLREAYEILELIEHPLPENKGGIDKRARYLDCAVIEMVHKLREPGTGVLSELMPTLLPYDTVRGAFWEGEELYPGAGFREKNHVQLCVRNPDCIKGYFRVIP